MKLYQGKFGDPEDDDEEQQAPGVGSAAYNVVREAERILHGS